MVTTCMQSLRFFPTNVIWWVPEALKTLGWTSWISGVNCLENVNVQSALLMQVKFSSVPFSNKRISWVSLATSSTCVLHFISVYSICEAMHLDMPNRISTCSLKFRPAPVINISVPPFTEPLDGVTDVTTGYRVTLDSGLFSTCAKPYFTSEFLTVTRRSMYGGGWEDICDSLHLISVCVSFKMVQVWLPNVTELFLVLNFSPKIVNVLWKCAIFGVTLNTVGVSEGE